MTKSKDLILKLREVQREKKLSYDKILSLMERDGEFTSKATLSRLFGKKWEGYSFDYEQTLIPIANVLLDVDNIEADDDTETQAFKSLLRLKMSVIDENAKQISELKEQIKDVANREKIKYHEKLQAETDKFQKSLDFAKHQIELKDKRIDQLMASNDRLSITNDRLINQLLNCPLKNEVCNNEGR